MKEVKSKIAGRFEISRGGPISEMLGVRCEYNHEPGTMCLSHPSHIDDIIATFLVNTMYPCSAPGGTHD